LMPIATKCFAPRLHVLFTKAPRVFHIGDWCVTVGYRNRA